MGNQKNNKQKSERIKCFAPQFLLSLQLSLQLLAPKSLRKKKNLIYQPHYIVVLDALLFQVRIDLIFLTMTTGSMNTFPIQIRTITEWYANTLVSNSMSSPLCWRQTLSLRNIELLMLFLAEKTRKG